MHHNKKLDDIVTEMRAISQQLVRYTFPKVAIQEEQEILPLKVRSVDIDGYEVVVSFSRAEYKKDFVESLQIQARYSLFLPFNVVCKLGIAFLGDKYLAYTDFFKEDHKIYCWMIRLENNQVVPPTTKAVPASFENFDYYMLNPGYLDFHNAP